jgi:hypothetical protein
VNLLTAKVQAGHQDVSTIEAEIAQALGIEVDGACQVASPVSVEESTDSQGTDTSKEISQNQGSDDDLETGIFTILEVRDGRSPGTVRAWCEGPEGKVAVFAKNGTGQALRDALGRQIEARYRRGDKGLIAFSVRLAG